MTVDDQQPETQPSTPRSESVDAERPGDATHTMGGESDTISPEMIAAESATVQTDPSLLRSGEEPGLALLNGEQPTQPSTHRGESAAAEHPGEETYKRGEDSNTISPEMIAPESATVQTDPSLLRSGEEPGLATVQTDLSLLRFGEESGVPPVDDQRPTRPSADRSDSVTTEAMDTREEGSITGSDETTVPESSTEQMGPSLPEDIIMHDAPAASSTLPDDPAVTAGEPNGAGETTPVGDEPADDVEGHGMGSGKSIRIESRDGLLCILPTPEQWGNIPDMYQIAAKMGAARDGAFKIIVPEQSQTLYSLSEPDREREFPAYRFSFRPIYPKTIGVIRTGAEEQLPSEHEREASTASTDELVRKFEELKAKSYKAVRYFSDLNAQNTRYRGSIGLPSTSPIFPLPGTRLEQTRERIPGVHWPYAYISAEPFGAPFALHIEDGWLSSVNYLYAGEKIWFIIPSDQRE